MNLKTCTLGIELGSTRIKGVLLDENHKIAASGSFDWENRLENGIWTYPIEEVATFAVEERYGHAPVACFGVFKAGTLPRSLAWREAARDEEDIRERLRHVLVGQPG